MGSDCISSRSLLIVLHCNLWFLKFSETVLRLAHETLMTEHLGIKKTLDTVVSELFGLEFVVMWLGFVNRVTFVRGLFRKVVLQRYFWGNCHLFTHYLSEWRWI